MKISFTNDWCLNSIHPTLNRSVPFEITETELLALAKDRDIMITERDGNISLFTDQKGKRFRQR